MKRYNIDQLIEKFGGSWNGPHAEGYLDCIAGDSLNNIICTYYIHDGKFYTYSIRDKNLNEEEVRHLFKVIITLAARLYLKR